MAYEERLAKAESEMGWQLPMGSVRNEYWASPWLVYFETFDHARATQAEPTGVAPAPASNGALDLAWAGAMQASWNVKPGSAAGHNWTYAAGALLLLDLLVPQSESEKRFFAEIAERRQQSLLTPSIHFIRRAPGELVQPPGYLITRAPGAPEPTNGYKTIRESSLVIDSLGLGCEPALLYAPSESKPFVGGPNRWNARYMRKYVCGFTAGERLSEKKARDEVKTLTLIGYTDYEPLLIFSLGNLPAMLHMRTVLGVAPENDKNMGRLAYERVRDRLPADWTVVFTAPNEAGKWTVYVARNGVIDAFDAPDKL